MLVASFPTDSDGHRLCCLSRGLLSIRAPGMILVLSVLMTCRNVVKSLLSLCGAIMRLRLLSEARHLGQSLHPEWKIEVIGRLTLGV